MSLPDLQLEKQYRNRGFGAIAGCDEVGMGCLAGPVVSAAVILDFRNIPEGINDSKKLSPGRREELDQQIRATALSISIAHASVEEIDDINIYHAAKLAMKRAVEGLNIPADFVLFDGRGTMPVSIPQLAVVKGDQKSVSIAAASVIAKVFRDNLMRELDEKYPGYDFAKHKGYGSVSHRKALQNIGPSLIHRKSFSWTPV